jgi:hypothetical protein
VNRAQIVDLRAPAPLVRKLNAKRRARRDPLRPWHLIALGMACAVVYELWQVIP